MENNDFWKEQYKIVLNPNEQTFLEVLNMYKKELFGVALGLESLETLGILDPGVGIKIKQYLEEEFAKHRGERKDINKLYVNTDKNNNIYVRAIERRDDPKQIIIKKNDTKLNLEKGIPILKILEERELEEAIGANLNIRDRESREILFNYISKLLMKSKKVTTDISIGFLEGLREGIDEENGNSEI